MSGGGLFGRLAAPSLTRASGTPSYGLIAMGASASATGMLVNQASAMTVSTVHACVNRIATDLARCTPSLYRSLKDGSEEAVTDHPVAELFKRPNQQQTWFEWSWMVWAGFCMKQNGYSAIRRARNGDPIELIPINPDAVMVLEASDGSVLYNVNRVGLWQMAMLREFPTAISSEDMLHLRGLTFNALVGVSTINLAKDAIGLAMGQEQQASRWIGNGARPSTWLKTARNLSEGAAKRLKSQFDDLFSGPCKEVRTH